jgi:hypothetical protein
MADIKRMRYFDQQLLVLKDFTDEQAYHRRCAGVITRRCTTGVATGLDVSGPAAKEVTAVPVMLLITRVRGCPRRRHED